MAVVGQGMCEAFERLAPMLPLRPALLSDDQLVGFAQLAEQLGRHVDALRLGSAREIDNRSDRSLGEDSLARRLGAKSAAGAVENVTRTSAEDARKRLTEARALAKLPVIDDAVCDGRLGWAQAAEIAAPILKVLRAADPAAVGVACEHLVELSEAVPASAVVEAAKAWAAVLDPDGIEPEEKSAFEKRFVRLGKARDGLVKLSGLLTVEQAATIRCAVDAIVNPRSGVAFEPVGDGEFSDGSAPAGSAPDDAEGLAAPVDTRDLGQKTADALTMMAARAARDADSPTMGGVHPTILVTVAADDLEAGTGPAWVDGEGEPVSAATAKRIACSGGFQPVGLGVGGEVLDLGRAQRCFSPAQRRALAARDGGCVVPGCTVAARWCEIHHLINWQHGGLTDVGNAVLLCWYHHFIVDDGPWQFRMTGGIPEIRWVFGSHASPWVTAVHRPRR